MKIFFDTEFVDNGVTIDLISIGMVKENGLKVYLENKEFDWATAPQWHHENVKPYLYGGKTYTRSEIRELITEYVSLGPIEFWAYCGAYDYVALLQLFGRAMQKPRHWPMYVNDVRPFAVARGIFPRTVPHEGNEHNALDDAMWARCLYNTAAAAESKPTNEALRLDRDNIGGELASVRDTLAKTNNALADMTRLYNEAAADGLAKTEQLIELRGEYATSRGFLSGLHKKIGEELGPRGNEPKTGVHGGIRYDIIATHGSLVWLCAPGSTETVVAYTQNVTDIR